MSYLIIHPKGLTANYKFALTTIVESSGIAPTEAHYFSLEAHFPKYKIRKTKTQIVPNDEIKQAVFTKLDTFIKLTNARVIITFDPIFLTYLTGQTSLQLCRGSVYFYRSIPVIILDKIEIVNQRRYGTWLYKRDLRKAVRWHNGTQMKEPKFKHIVCHTTRDLQEACDFLNNCDFIAYDIETSHRMITSIAFTGLNCEGYYWTYVIPFANPTKPGGNHWLTEAEEICAQRAMKEICENDAVKIAQNGSYDASYLIREHIAVNNYLLDVMHMHHSLYCELPKKIGFITSLYVDNYRYWKDLHKGTAEDKDKAEAVPQTQAGLEMYWKYNGLDTHYTMLAGLFLVRILGIPSNGWVRKNYDDEFRQQMGFAFIASCRGIFVNDRRRTRKSIEWMKESKSALLKIRREIENPDFNPNSNHDVEHLLYDVLGAQEVNKNKKTKTGRRSVDKVLLRVVASQGPLFKHFIDLINDVKEPLNNNAKYGEMELYNGRFLYSLGAGNTVTTRYSGKAHNLWLGTNPQNIPAEHRDMFVSPPGYLFFNLDFSASDSWFIAHTAQDEKMIDIVSNAKDTHCQHAVVFFERDYDEIYAGYKEEAEWVVHPIKGVRQNTKRITHGCNYRMAGYTMFLHMGREAVVATAIALGWKNANDWLQRKLVKFCDYLISKYFGFYPRMIEWFEEIVQECVQNGNRATTAFGFTRVFFGNVASDSAIQRELASFFGQGGTAGNINRTLNRVIWDDKLDNDDMIFVLQVHDNIVGYIREDKLDELQKLLTIMKEPVTIHGRTFSVPVDVKVGYSWHPKLMRNPFSKDFSLDTLKQLEAQWDERYYGNPA